MPSNAHLPLPELVFSDGTPLSQAFGDVYFSREGGIAETEYVFLRGNGLPGRWKRVTIVEGDLAPYATLTPAATRLAMEGYAPTLQPSVGPPRSADGPRACPPKLQRRGKPERSERGGAQRGDSYPPRGNSHHQYLPFTIAELGFGTGLNFLVTWQSFLQIADPTQHLHYWAVEKFPLTPEMLGQALALHPTLSPLADQLLAAYPLRLPGLHRIHLERVTLTLAFGDAAAMLGEFSTAVNVDAWYLDGFSPAKNPAMWNGDVMHELGRLSAPGATLATFTVAAHVREGLEAQGFKLARHPGFGKKREMLVGTKEGDLFPCALRREPERSERGGAELEATLPPRSDDSHHQEPPRSADGPREPERQRTRGSRRRGILIPHASYARQITILGAGIAGCSLARALAERGMQVTVLERSTIASGASGNAAAVLFPQLAKRWSPMAAWYFAAYRFMLHQLKRLPTITHAQPGMLRLPRHAAEAAHLQHLHETLGLDATMVHWLDRDAASETAGVELQSGGAFFPQGTWLNPTSYCTTLLQHENIMLHEHAAAISCNKKGREWVVTLADGREFAAAHCAVATAHEAGHLLPQHALPLGVSAGQVSMISAAEVAAPLRTILCHKGYIIPAGAHYLIGATYDHTDHSGAVTDANHQHNVAELSHVLPHWFHGSPTTGRTSLRATTPDRLPYVGAVEDGLWVSLGHGSRGMLSAPLAAEIIASELCGEALPVTQSVRHAVRPWRHKREPN